MPLKVDGLSGQRTGPEVHMLEHPDAVHGSSGADTDFATQLEEQGSGFTDEQMDALLHEIDKQGEKLSKSPTFDELVSYRDLVKTFIGEAVSRMYSVHAQVGWDHLGRQKAYTIVRKIDRKMEEMAEKIRLGQTDKLDIIASHDAIRGMLVDLYM